MHTDNPTITTPEISSQEHEIRVKKVQELRSKGIEPWPSKKEVTATSSEFLAGFPANENKVESLAGRVMALRKHGKTVFAKIQDRTGVIQLYLKADTIGAEQFELFDKYIDLGDYIWVQGAPFLTKTEEITVRVDQFTLLSKCLHPLPEKFHGIADVEIRYRQRYLDLITNHESREKFKIRSKLVSGIRHYLESHDFMEVETPMLHPIPGGAAARPFVTHHNALASDLYLRIAPELYLKRLVIGGFERVYEINRNFRNEGVSTRHNPEFTMLEFYIAHEDYTFAMNITENMLKKSVLEACGKLVIDYGNHTIDFAVPFAHYTVKESVIKIGKLTEENIAPHAIDATVKKYCTKSVAHNASWGEKVYALFEELVEHQLIQPTFITKFPIEVSPLAKRDPLNEHFVPRFELFIGGMEIANSYNELNEPFDQKDRFLEQVKSHEAGNDEAHHFDADYIRALEYGLPPTVGCGVGIDRLTMLVTNTLSIKDVILFPALKRKEA